MVALDVPVAASLLLGRPCTAIDALAFNRLIFASNLHVARVATQQLRAIASGAAHSFDELIRAARERRPPSSAVAASAQPDAADAIAATADSGGVRNDEPADSGRADTEPDDGASDHPVDAGPETRQRSPMSHGISAAMHNGGPHNTSQHTEEAEDDEEAGDPWQAQSPLLPDEEWREQEPADIDPADAGLAQRAPDESVTPQARDDTGLQLVLEPA